MRLKAMAAALTLGLAATTPATAEHAIAMHGAPKYPAGFSHFGYANPAAPKGGSLTLGRTGTFDSLNPFIVRGSPAEGRRHSHQSLLARAYDEPFSLYGLIAEDVAATDDRQSVTFRLRTGARFHDGSDITVDDVLFSYETLREQGRPNHRFYYGQVERVERPGPRSVRFHFKDTGNRELPLIMGLMPVLSRTDFRDRDFDRVSQTPLMGSGPYRVDGVDPGRSITYRRIPGHWSENLPAQRGLHNFDTVRYEYFRDDTAMLEAFKAGQVDLRLESDPAQWATGYDFPARARGDVTLMEFPHGRPTGMYGIALNTRRAVFQDPRVRHALAHAFDFNWLNKNLFHGAYRRTRSYFQNSELAATGLPGPAELALLEPFREGLPDELFTAAYAPPASDGSGRIRGNLRAAQRLLQAAGWDVRDRVLTNTATGAPFRFELMLLRRGNERIALNLARNLEKLGIAAEVRTVDSAQYQQRTATYDFDAMIYLWDPSLSPGNEQAFYWSCDAARREGTRNYPGICVPAIDQLVQTISDAPDRGTLVAAVRAMDRVLQWGHYVIPLFHLTGDRVAVWDRFGRPDQVPVYGYRLETWWEVEPRS